MEVWNCPRDGALIALVLCVQCMRTYRYTDSVLVPEQAEHEAGRQAAAFNAAAHGTGITDPRRLAPFLKRVMASSSDRILWMRVLDLNGNVFSQSGVPEGAAKFPSRWWNRVQEHENVGSLRNTTQGQAWIVMLPLRLPRSPESSSANPSRNFSQERRTAYVLEIAIPLQAVSSAFDGLRQNLIVGLIASLALLIAVAVIALRLPRYLRGKYLEAELQLAKHVQNDLRPKAQSLSPYLEFAASAVSADQVGGDFYDVFQAESGEIAIVLGDVSGKGIPAALLVSVLHGAIRSSTASQHEFACERINRMLCERTACERFATLFWGVFDPATRIFRYVNAGHVPPLLVRQTGFDRGNKEVIRLGEGGPVLGLLANACYAAGTIQIENTDTLVLYSDGISEASNRHEQEFGEDRIQHTVFRSSDVSPAELCDRILNQVTSFASPDLPSDDCTLLAVKFKAPGTSTRARQSEALSEVVA